MKTIDLFNARKKIIDKLLITLAYLASLTFISSIVALYFPTMLYQHSTYSAWFLFKLIWLPSVPMLLLWLFIVLAGLMRWRFITIIILIFSSLVVKNCLLGLSHLKGVTGLLYWIIFFNNRLGFITITFNLFTFLIWVYFMHRNQLMLEKVVRENSI